MPAAAQQSPHRHSAVAGGGDGGGDADFGEQEFFMPVRLTVLEDTSRAMDGHFAIDAVTDVAALSPGDQLATLQAAFHALGESDAPTAIRDHDIFDVLYSFVKALPDGTVTKECRGLLATELATALHKLARMISRLCQQRRSATANVDDRRFKRIAVISRSCVRMLTLLLQHTLTAPPRHRDSNGEDGMSQMTQQTRTRQRQRRARAGANLGSEDTHGDGVDVAAKEATLTGFIESLAFSSAEIWGATDTNVHGLDEATSTAMLKTALHLLAKQASLVGGAGGTARGEEDPVVEGLLFLLKALAAKFTKAYDAAVTAATASAATNAPAAAAVPEESADPLVTPPEAPPAEPAGRASARLVVSAAHPRHVLISPLVELLLQSVPPTSTAATAPLPRLVSRLLGLVHGDAADDEGADQYGIAALAASTGNSPVNDGPGDPPAAQGEEAAALTNATTWSSKFVSWTLEAVAQSAVTGDISGDGNAAKNVAALLEELARNHVTLVANHAPLIMPVLHSDSYEARKAAITAISELITQKYTAAAQQQAGAAISATENALRDQYLEDLMARLRDLNPFVRSHTLKKWAALVEHKAVPKHLHVRLTREGVDRVVDRHYHVRRAALMLLESILKRGQWFHSTVSERLFRARLLEHAGELEAQFASREAFIRAVDAVREAAGLGDSEFVLVSSFAHPPAYAPEVIAPVDVDPDAANAVAAPDDDEQPPAAPTMGDAAVQYHRVKLSRVVFYQSAVDFSCLMGIALQAAVDLLASRTHMDVMQAIHFVAAASDMKLDGSASAVAKMLTLIYVHDQQTQFAVCEAFAHIFFDSFNALKVNQATRNQARVYKLISVLKTASDGEISGIERILLYIRGANSTTGVKPPPFVSSMLGTVNEAFLDNVWDVINAAPDDQLPMAAAAAAGTGGAALDAADKRAALQLYVLLTSTLLPRDVAARKATILAAMKANATQPRFCALSLDALARESGLRGFVRLDTSENSALAINPHSHAALSAAVHQLARPTRILNQWLAVATSAVACIHALCSHPAEIFAAVVRHVAADVEAAMGLRAGQLASQKKLDPSELSEDSAVRVTQLCFILGHSAVKQLVTIDTYERSQLKVLDDAASGKNATAAGTGTGDTMQKELGIGGVDFERMQLAERCQAARVGILNPKGARVVDQADVDAASSPTRQSGARRSGRASGRAEAGRPSMTLNAGSTRLNVPEGLWGKYAPLVVRLCSTAAPKSRAAESATAVSLRAVAATALLKLMTASEDFCGQQLRLVFTLLSRATESWQLKTNVVIGLGDIACVHPNTLAPYMKVSNSGFYALLADSDVRVRAVTIQVCTHLVLNDMLRVTEHLHSIVRLVADTNEAIRNNAQLFVQHLAVKLKHNLGNVIAPLVTSLSLPSDAAALAMATQTQEAEGSSASPRRASASARKSASTAVLPPLNREEFQTAVGPLIEALSDSRAGEKEKRAAEGLIDKLCGRFPAFYNEADPSAQGLARNIAFALGELNYTSEKMMKRLMSEACYGKYRQWLRDAEVHRLLQTIATKARRAAPGAAARQAAAAAGEQATSGAERRDRATIEEWERRMAGDAGVAEAGADGDAAAAPSADGAVAGDIHRVDAPGALVDASTDEDGDDKPRAPARRSSTGVRASTASKATSGRSSRRSVKEEPSSSSEDDDDDDDDESDSSSAAESQESAAAASASDDDDANVLGAASKKKGTKKKAAVPPKKKGGPKKAAKSSQANKKSGGKKR